MKTKLFCLLLLTILSGCSPNNSRKLSSEAAGALPPTKIVETPEFQERNQIKAQALALLEGRKYQDLEALAAKYRISKEQYSDGYWKLWLAYKGLEPADDASEQAWQARLAQVHDWIQARPESVMPRILQGRILSDYAWYARSSGYASKVSDEQWKTFFDRLNQASQALQEAAGLAEKCPIYWSSMELVALGSQAERSDYDTIFNESIRQYPDYSYYYYNRATFLLPRWYGKPGEWEADLTKSADKVGGEAGDMLYARVVWDIGDYGDIGNIFEGGHLTWERVDRGFEAILKQFPDSLAARSEWAYLASLAGDKKRAQDCLRQMKGEVDLSVWQNVNLYIGVANWAFKP